MRTRLASPPHEALMYGSRIDSLAAIVSSCAALKVCSKFGRKPTIQAASMFFLTRAALRSAAQLLWMLLIGRVLLCICVGFGNEV
ncbi:hypothetical protein Gorai_006155 [Gossypium raimondii]|uniref:Major facilitator superfamily (MFS) profile domain-containing protein n=1 Tax=Gossypium raimondii TaxID=29730 RepID=A0A7J8QEG5_GOSRA|nr:hypothetical protein [Gossypium raimondii]